MGLKAHVRHERLPGEAPDFAGGPAPRPMQNCAWHGNISCRRRGASIYQRLILSLITTFTAMNCRLDPPAARAGAVLAVLVLLASPVRAMQLWGL